MNNPWYEIHNFEEFVNASRALIFNSFGKNLDGSDQDSIDSLIDFSQPADKEELDKSLSYDESAAIAKAVFTLDQDKYFGSDKDFMKFLELLNDRLVSNILNNLANMGLVESAYDSDSNDFIFWIKDEHKEDIKKFIENPETD
jgi:predicted transcriptional regulator